MFSHHIVIHAHITQPFIIFHTPSQKRGLVLRTLEFDKWIVNDSAVRLDGGVYHHLADESAARKRRHLLAGGDTLQAARR